MTHNERLAATELDAWLENRIRGNVASPLGSEGTPDAALIEHHLSMASKMTIDPAFKASLYARLAAAHTARRQGIRQSFTFAVRSWREKMINYVQRSGMNTRGVRPQFIIGIAVLVSMLLAAPVLGQTILNWIRPQVVDRLPNNVPASTELLPSAPLDQIEKRAGYALLLPSYLPENCGRRNTYVNPGQRYDATVDTVFINYPCVTISSRPIRANVQQPLVGDNATETVSVNGQPALLIRGVWESFDNQPATWNPNGGLQLIFQYRTLQVMVEAHDLTKAELIKVAASLKPR